jgi:beta-lactam-binding protein with PASTA domain
MIDTGAELTDGTSVVLVVGQGLSDAKINLPSFRAKTLEEVQKQSLELMLNIGAVHYDVQPANAEDARLYFVYKQKPISGSEVQLGKYIDVWLTKDKSQLDTPEETVDDYIKNSLIDEEF